MKYFVVDDGDMIIPKSVRPTIDYEETYLRDLGEKRVLTGNFALAIFTLENMMSIIQYIEIKLIQGKIRSGIYWLMLQNI